jgi:coproporphyrinogen III oxidase-like Fe-S oxidoreductase
MDALEAEGLLARNETRLAVTSKGRLVLNRLLLELAA